MKSPNEPKSEFSHKNHRKKATMFQKQRKYETRHDKTNKVSVRPV